jgi:hypothetical protein
MDDPREGVVLLDVPPGADGEFDRAELERLGHPVHLCHGPPLGTVCPLLDDRGCPLFSQAHGIVFQLDLRRSHHQAILRRYQELARLDMPVRVVVSPADAERYADLLRDVEVWTHEPTVADLDGFAARVEAADLVRDEDQ